MKTKALIKSCWVAVSDFFKINFFRKNFQEYHQSDNCFVGPDLSPSCLQSLSEDDIGRLS